MDNRVSHLKSMIKECSEWKSKAQKLDKALRTERDIFFTKESEWEERVKDLENKYTLAEEARVRLEEARKQWEEERKQYRGRVAELETLQERGDEARCNIRDFKRLQRERVLDQEKIKGLERYVTHPEGDFKDE